jgi:hypothetical protein
VLVLASVTTLVSTLIAPDHSAYKGSFLMVGDLSHDGAAEFLTVR